MNNPLAAVGSLPGSMLGVADLSRQVEELREEVRALGVMPASIDRVGEDTKVLRDVLVQLETVAEATTSMERSTKSIAATVPALVALEQSLPALVPVLEGTSNTLAQLQTSLNELEATVQALANAVVPLQGAAERLNRLGSRWSGRRGPEE